MPAQPAGVFGQRRAAGLGAALICCAGWLFAGQSAGSEHGGMLREEQRLRGELRGERPQWPGGRGASREALDDAMLRRRLRDLELPARQRLLRRLQESALERRPDIAAPERPAPPPRVIQFDD